MASIYRSRLGCTPFITYCSGRFLLLIPFIMSRNRKLLSTTVRSLFVPQRHANKCQKYNVEITCALQLMEANFPSFGLIYYPFNILGTVFQCKYIQSYEAYASRKAFACIISYYFCYFTRSRILIEIYRSKAPMYRLIRQ